MEDDEDIEDHPMTQKLLDLLNSHHSEKMITGGDEVEAPPHTLLPKNYLKIKPFLVPKPKGPSNLIKEHYMFVDWKKLSKGGVVCINQEHIDDQKKVFKTVIGQLGSRIAKMKGIMNISLPIFICKPE